MLTEQHTGVEKLPNRRRYKKAIKESWGTVYYFKFKSSIQQSIKQNLKKDLKRMQDFMGAFNFYHDYSMRRWYVSDEKIAAYIKLAYNDYFDRGVNDHAM